MTEKKGDAVRGRVPGKPTDAVRSVGERASSIQNDFFNRARRDGTLATIFLTNGKKLSGRIKSFDKFTVVVESNRVDQMIFKHAISTVSMGRPQREDRPEGEDE